MQDILTFERPKNVFNPLIPKKSNFNSIKDIINPPPNFTTIQTPSFMIKFFNNRNKTLQRFLLELTPSKQSQLHTIQPLTKRESLVDFLNKEDTIQEIHNKFHRLHSKCCTPQPSERRGNQVQSDTERMRQTGSISPTLKKKVITELYQYEKTSTENGGLLKNSSIEDIENMMDIHMLKDGSILVKPNSNIETNFVYSQVSEKEKKTEELANSPGILGKKVKMSSSIGKSNKPKSEHNSFNRNAESKPNPVQKARQVECVSEEPIKIIMDPKIEKIKNDEEKERLHPKRLSCIDIRESKSDKKIIKKDVSAPTLKEKSNRISHEVLEPILYMKPETTIKMINWKYDHLIDHPINVALKNVSQLVFAAFKRDTAHSANAIVKYAKKIGLKLIAAKLTPDFLKAKENFNMIKEKAIIYLNQILNTENNLEPHEKPVSNYRYFVGKGNNSMLVKNSFKQRWWWTSVEKEEIDKANLVWTQLLSRKFMATLPSQKEGAANREQLAMANHLENHFHISNKKAMFLNIKSYFERMGKDAYDILPLTFHIKGYDDPELAKFEEYYNKLSKDTTLKNIWIIKPGEYTNRGRGITVAKDLQEIKSIIKKTEAKRTNIIQKYIEKPLLINKRKFDIRCYGMVTSMSGLLKGYWYNEGYLRTSCKEFNTKNLNNKYIHLTNDAVQKNNEEYGKYEAGNKLSYQDLQKYFDVNYSPLNIDFNRDINSQIKVHYSTDNHY